MKHTVSTNTENKLYLAIYTNMHQYTQSKYSDRPFYWLQIISFFYTKIYIFIISFLQIL